MSVQGLNSNAAELECGLCFCKPTSRKLTETQGVAFFLQALSPVGRCKTFDASGDGYGRGEGCAVAVLKQAAPGELPALAMLKVTATNQDGRSSGLTAPSGPSQRALIATALQNAGVQPAYIVLSKNLSI